MIISFSFLMANTHLIILFDGICNFCNSSVNFIIKRDIKDIFRFASLQSDKGQQYLSKFNLSQKEFGTIILIENDEFYTRSTSVLRIAKKLKGIWKLFYIFIIIPSPFRNFFYSLISKHRYKWFGKRDVCRIPTEEEKSRFLI
jgi:predicted DCC family thiol-disulfide oxidoreductase YuxK